MKKISLFIMGILIGCSVYAQLPQWVIPPVHDTIFVKMDNVLLQTMTGEQSSLWTMDGKKLFSTENKIMPFKEGVATVVRKDGNTIVGLVYYDGSYVDLPDLTVVYDNPFFENGLLLVKENDEFTYYSRNGVKEKTGSCVRTYPFHRGYAPFFTYLQKEKKKDPCYAYFRADGKAVHYRIMANGSIKYVEPKDILFVSGIGTIGKGVAVIKDKLYWFNPETEVFEPFLWGDESEKKRHLTVIGDYEAYFANLPNDGVIIQAKYGKNQMAQLCFDKELLPTIFHFMDGEIVFEEKTPTLIEHPSVLTAYGAEVYGLAYKDVSFSDNGASTPIIPEQFEQVGLMYGNRAFVKKNGKWGILEIIPDLKISLRINKGEDIAFRHQKFETQIRLDLPVEISAKETRLDIPESTGCLIDKTSRVSKDTESGNFLTYDCVLTIPDSLPDKMTTVSYSPVNISCEGIELFSNSILVNAWHLKYYNVDPIESETSITDGVASFTININAQKNVGEGDYPFDVKIQADKLSVEVFEKISETRYKCLISNLQEGENSLNILVIEKGCPASVFPFEVVYVKSVPEEKRKEEVIVRKRTPAFNPPARIEL